MPPVSQRYRDARRRQVVDAARRCFARKGFEASSMQEICTQAGLSAGAIYGYFPSKDHLIAAIVDEVLAEITTGLETLEHHDPPVLHKAVAHLFAVLDRPEHGGELARLAVQVWAEAAGNPALRNRLAAHYRDLQTRFTLLVQHCQRAGTLDPDLAPGDLAQVLTALGPAFLSQRALLDDAVTAEAFTNGLRALTTTGLRTAPSS
ncbi:MAG: TetR/AcrR family transcriptional regulator [Pseudonocardiaceae bacterium]